MTDHEILIPLIQRLCVAVEADAMRAIRLLAEAARAINQENSHYHKYSPEAFDRACEELIDRLSEVTHRSEGTVAIRAHAHLVASLAKAVAGAYTDPDVPAAAPRPLDKLN